MRFFLDQTEQEAYYESWEAMSRSVTIASCCPLREQNWHGRFDRIYLEREASTTDGRVVSYTAAPRRS